MLDERRELGKRLAAKRQQFEKRRPLSENTKADFYAQASEGDRNQLHAYFTSGLELGAIDAAEARKQALRFGVSDWRREPAPPAAAAAVEAEEASSGEAVESPRSAVGGQPARTTRRRLAANKMHATAWRRASTAAPGTALTSTSSMEGTTVPPAGSAGDISSS